MGIMSFYLFLISLSKMSIPIVIGDTFIIMDMKIIIFFNYFLLNKCQRYTWALTYEPSQEEEKRN
jgi:hypothetical protein